MARVLITGCSTGIGRATAIELAARGHEVVATARRPETLDDLDVDVRLALDVDDEESIREAVAAAGRIDVLVNNAGYEVSGPIEKVPVDAERAMFETNFFGAVRMVQAVVPAMRERGDGVIVNVSSIAGRVAAPLNGFYASSKFALEAVSEAMHYELNHFGIRTVVIEPGLIETAFSGSIRHIGKDSPPYDELDGMWSGANEALVPAGRPGPDLVARAIADAIADPSAALRHPVGSDAEMIASTRASMTDAEFESTMRAVLGLAW